jgi:hypothetical protein
MWARAYPWRATNEQPDIQNNLLQFFLVTDYHKVCWIWRKYLVGHDKCDCKYRMHAR